MVMPKILYISLIVDSYSGGGMVSKMLKSAISDYCPGNVTTIEFPIFKSLQKKLIQVLFGNVYGMTSNTKKQIFSILEKNEFDIVFINSSAFGNVIKKIKRLYPKLRIISFFHNVEANYVSSSFKYTHNIGTLLTLAAISVNEKNTINFSDTIICLTNRDSEELARLYGRKADTIIPICLSDRFDINKLSQNKNELVIGTFIGSNFIQNYHGIKWFVENVAPFVNAQILIIGKGFENNKIDLEIHNNIKVIGTVDNLEDYYYGSDFIISPIFLGSGMKTKTIEALMFGKTIFGTNEAFVGCQIDFSKVGNLCNTKNEFIESINSYVPISSKYNNYSREFYLDNFSSQKFKSLINSIILPQSIVPK